MNRNKEKSENKSETKRQTTEPKYKVQISTLNLFVVIEIYWN
jgi:hypothetical protein